MANTRRLSRTSTKIQALVPGAARVAVVAGGCCQALAQDPEITGADVIVYLDVRNELEAVRSRAGVLVVALVPGETLGTLAAKGASEAFNKYLATRPGVDLSVGLGQLRPVGDLAVRKLLDDPAFATFLVVEVFERLLIKHNGELERVEITVYRSSAGGTGGPSGPAVARAIAQVLFDRTDAVVHLRYFLAGSLSYVRLGERIHYNGAANVAEDLEFVRSCERHPREVRSLELFELPMVGPMKPQRDRRVVQLVQAAEACSTREVLERGFPNDAMNSAYGTVSIFRPSYWQELPDQRIAAEAAWRYIPRLKRLLSTGPQPGRIERIRITLKPVTIGTPLDEIIDMVRRSRAAQPQDLLTLCTLPRVRYALAKVSVKFFDGDVVNLTDELRTHLAKQCQSEAEFTARLALMRTLDATLESEAHARIIKLEALRRQQTASRTALEKALRQLYPTGWWERVAATVLHYAAKIASFKNALARVWSISDESLKLEAEVQALRAVRAELGVELEAERRRLQELIEALSPFQPKGNALHRDEFVDMTELDAILPELLTAAPHGSYAPEFLGLLRSCVERVTLAGMAEIFQAPEPRIDSVAAQIARGTPPAQAPAWACKKLLHRGRLVTVLPPVSEQLEEELRASLAKLDQEMVLVSADTARGGVNAIRLEVHKPRHREEIITSFLRKNLEEVLKAPEIYFTSGFPYQQLLKPPPDQRDGPPAETTGESAKA